MEESMQVCRPSLLISELLEGYTATKKLEENLHEIRSMDQSCSSLVQSIIASWEKAISLARTSIIQEQQQHVFHFTGATETESPGSAKHQKHKETFKKRKTTLEKWTTQVKVCTAAGFDVPSEDGSSWRKYGQKEIHGAKYPRGYYRCTHRHSQGCMATKQVQRSESDDTVFDVTYHGKHTCFPKPSQNQENVHGNSDYQVLQNQETLPRIRTELDSQNIISHSFPFTSTPTTPLENDNYYYNIFPSLSTHDNQFIGSSSTSPFISPSNSETDFNCHVPFVETTSNNLQNSDTGFMEMTPSGTPIDFDESFEFNQGFPFDPSFFS